MRDTEIQLFIEGMNSAKDEFFLEAIAHMHQLVKDFPDSELVDDAIYNIGLCYFNMNQFETAITFFKKSIDEYPDGIISVLTGGDEYGNTAAKCWYGILNCHLAIGRIDDAKKALSKMSVYSESYVQKENGEKITYEKLANSALQIFTKQINKKLNK